MSAETFASVTPVEKLSVAPDAKTLWSAVARASVTSVAKKNAVTGLFCFGRASHKNFWSRQAQKFLSVVIFASFAPVAKAIPSAVTCAPFEAVKTKLRSAETCTSAAPVAKTFSRARHKKKTVGGH